MADAGGVDASIAVAHFTVCKELGCQPCDAFVDAIRSGSSPLQLRDAGSDSTLFATASLLPYTRFEEIDLSGLHLEPEGWQALLEACAKCRALNVLSLKGCALGSLGEAAAEQVAQLLGACQISVLDASQNGLGDAFASALARSGVLANGRLAVLDLSDNAVTCAGASSLAAALQAAGPRAALRQLDLGYNRIGDAGAEELAAAVAAAPVVASLELERNQVGDAGAQALARALCEAPELQRLNLNFNAFGGNGLEALADALLVSPGALQELTVAGASGPGAPAGAAALLRAVAEGGCPLHLVDIRGVALEGEPLDALCTLLASPAPLVSLRADVASKEGAERIAQVLPANTSLVSLMLNGPVPKPVLSFIGAVLSSNALAHGSPAAVGSPPQRAAGTAAGERPGLGPARQQRAGQLEQAQPPANSTFAVSSGLQSRGGKRGASPGPGQAAAPAPALNRSLTVQARSAGAADPEGMRGLAAGGVSDKAAEVFRRHDTDCSGYLDEQEMMAALQDLGLLEGLTARQLGKFVSTALRESGTDRNGRISLGDFVDYYHRVARHFSDASRQGRIVARRRMPAPPLDAASDETLKKAFRAYCKLPVGRGRQVGASIQHMNAAQFRELARNAGLVETEGPLSQCAVDIVFTRCQAPGNRRLALKEFLQALAAAADEAGREFSTVRDSLAAELAAQQLQQQLRQQQQQPAQSRGGAGTRGGGGGAGGSAWLAQAQAGAAAGVPSCLGELLGSPGAAGSAGSTSGMEALFRSIVSPSAGAQQRAASPPARVLSPPPRASTPVAGPLQQGSGPGAAAHVPSASPTAAAAPQRTLDADVAADSPGGASSVQTNPLFEVDRNSRIRRIEEILVARSGGSSPATAASPAGPGALSGAAGSPGGPRAPQAAPQLQVAALAARLEALEAAGMRRQRQLDAVCTQQAQLTAELHRLADRLAGGGGSSSGSSQEGVAEGVQGLAARLAAAEAAVAELRADGGGVGRGAAEAFAKAERGLSERQARVETALMQVARHVDVLDTRLREEQETSLKALEAVVSGAAPGLHG